MKKIIFISLITIVGFSFAFYLGLALRTKNLPTTPTESITGVVRKSGFSEPYMLEEKESYGLKTSEYQITDFKKDEVYGYFIEQKDQEFNPYMFLGKCVKANIQVLESKNKTSIYGRLPAKVKGIQAVDYAECNPYIYPSTNPEIKETFKGVLQRFDRPAPDIGYDYVLNLDEPYPDNATASGLLTNVDSIFLVPNTNDVWKKIEINMNQPIEIKGAFEWGYAESKFFRIAEIKPILAIPTE